MRIQSRRAAVLIMVLWAIVVLSLIASGISFSVRQDAALGNIDRDRLVAHWSARAGVEQAIADIMDDFAGNDTIDDAWSDGMAYKEVAVGAGTFDVLQDRYEAAPLEWFGANDESAKLNVNVATREQLMRLPNMTTAVAAAIIDWRDRDENPEPDGIERGHYGSLPHPYNIRNGLLRTTRELLLVRGVTPELFYGEDLNVNGRLDANENDGDTSNPPDNADFRLDRGWYAYITMFTSEKNQSYIGEKRINLKNADAGTLANRLKLENWAAQSIVKRREQREFRNLVELLDVTLDASVQRGSTNEDINLRGDTEKNQPVTTSILKLIIDDLTLSDDEILGGRVNINTAPLEVLKTLLDDDLALAVLRERENVASFTSIADLLDIKSMTREKFAQIENYITVRSSVFRVLSRGGTESGLASATIECIVDRAEERPRVLYWLESSP